MQRRLAIGAEVVEGGAHVRVWAPRRRRVTVVVEGRPEVELRPEVGGYFAGLVEGVGAGARYRFRLDADEPLYPDPASRAQPDGPHGASEVVDPSAFRWTDGAWRGVALEGAVIYELHVGTFTPEGTWAAAARELPALRDLGVTVIEMMPVAEFDGRFGWGYDGVGLFAPTRLYGRPDDLRAFVDRAHALGIGVILDVVYNHLGPSGNYLAAFASEYFTDRFECEWGDAIDFSHPGVRELFVGNAGYWIDELHLDGLRLDATQSIFDESPEHVIAAIVRRVREAARGRATLVVAENEPQDADLVRRLGLDAIWNDDLHHSAMVALTGRREAYFSDHAGTPQELLSGIKHGFLFQGQRYAWQDQRRGAPALDVAAPRFVTFLQNHDQVPNATAHGARIDRLASAARLRAMTALWLLAPGTPMLFQGQEWAATAPFLYVADHGGELGEAVSKGRAAFVKQFPSVAAFASSQDLPDPRARETFARCVLDHGERARDPHARWWALHRDLLRLRREDPTFAAQRGWPALDGAVLGAEALALRYFGAGPDDDRLLIVNLGVELAPASIAEPLLAAPAGRRWTLAWTSEDPRYGGCGTAPVEHARGWRIQGQAAVVLRPASAGAPED